jgi:L-amino acid N-acyltransferase YncA
MEGGGMDKRIRSVGPGDAQAVADIYAPFVSDSATSFEAVAPDAAEIRKRIAELTPRYPWLVFEADGSVLGYAYASQHRSRHAYQWSADVSLYIHEKARNRHVGRALYTALFDLLRRQGYFNAYAGITLPNPGSVRLHESMGFTNVGVYSQVGFKFGRWHDVVWLQLRLLEKPVPAGPPLLPENLFGEPAVLSVFTQCAEMVKLNPGA